MRADARRMGLASSSAINGGSSHPVARGLVIIALMALASGCASLRGSGGDYDILSASEEMAPTNPRRGAKTLRVTTRVPPELEVRLVAFYSQFHPMAAARTPPNLPPRSDPRQGKVADGCWRSEFAVLQDVRSYYTRTFTYPVASGTQVQDLVLDEVVAGKCHIGITSVGYEVRLKAPKGDPVKRWVDGSQVGIAEVGAAAANAIVRCGVRSLRDSKVLLMRCDRDGQRDTLQLGPLASAGASLDFEFVFKDGIELLETFRW